MSTLKKTATQTTVTLLASACEASAPAATFSKKNENVVKVSLS